MILWCHLGSTIPYSQWKKGKRSCLHGLSGSGNQTSPTLTTGSPGFPPLSPSQEHEYQPPDDNWAWSARIKGYWVMMNPMKKIEHIMHIINFFLPVMWNTLRTNVIMTRKRSTAVNKPLTHIAHAHKRVLRYILCFCWLIYMCTSTTIFYNWATCICCTCRLSVFCCAYWVVCASLKASIV